MKALPVYGTSSATWELPHATIRPLGNPYLCHAVADRCIFVRNTSCHFPPQLRRYGLPGLRDGRISPTCSSSSRLSGTQPLHTEHLKMCGVVRRPSYSSQCSMISRSVRARRACRLYELAADLGPSESRVQYVETAQTYAFATEQKSDRPEYAHRAHARLRATGFPFGADGLPLRNYSNHAATAGAKLLAEWAQLGWPRRRRGGVLPVCTGLPMLQAAAAAIPELSALRMSEGLRLSPVRTLHRGRSTALLRLDGGDSPVLIGDVVGVFEDSNSAFAVHIEVPDAIETLEDETGPHWSNDLLRHYHFVPPGDDLFDDGMLERFLCNRAQQHRLVHGAPHHEATSRGARLSIKSVLLPAASMHSKGFNPTACSRARLW